jgi:PAS domain S-box-containing protein
MVIFMDDHRKTKRQLIEEINELKHSVTQLKSSDSKAGQDGLNIEKYSKAFLLNSVPMGITTMEEGRFVEISDAFLKLMGRKRHEVIGYTSIEIGSISVTQRESFISEFKKRNCIENFEMKVRTKGGESRTGLFNSVTISINNRSYLLTVMNDITERKRAEQETAILAEIGRVSSCTLDIGEIYETFAAEARKLIDFDRVVVNLHDFDQEIVRIIYVSGESIKDRQPGHFIPLKGSLSEVLIKTRAGILNHPKNIEEMDKQFPSSVSTIETGMRSLLSVPLISKNVVIAGLHFRSKKPNAYKGQDLRLAEKIGMQIAGAIANSQLYSNLQKTEKFLRESEKRFRTLIERAPVGVAEVDAETGRFLSVNPKLCEMLGRTEKELLAITFQAITHPDDLNLHPVFSEKLYAGKIDHYSLEKRYLRKDGGVVWANIMVSRLWKLGETQRNSITIIHDITERKQAEEALQKTLEQLESRVSKRTIELEETNIAMKILLKKEDKDQKRVEDRLQSNINQLVTPFLSKLRLSQSNEESRTYLNILEANLNNITSPFINQLSATYKSLTPKEIQIAELVKQGLNSKEIAQLFHVSAGTVVTHRNSIRKKLHLKSTNTNLRSYLLSLV